jgi:peptidase E
VEGGNTFWLQHCIDKGQYSQLIIDACTGESGAVYCGKSAGAIVAGDDVSTATWKGWDDPSVVPNRETYDDWIGTRGFQFSESLSFFPHMSDDWIELVNDKVKGKEANSTCCLREEEVCCITGERKQRFVVSGAAPEC